MSDKVLQFRLLDDENYVFKSPEKEGGGVNISKKAVDKYKNKVNLLVKANEAWGLEARFYEIRNRLQELSKMKENSYNPELFDEVRFQRMKEKMPNITKAEFIAMLSKDPAIMEEEQALLLEGKQISELLVLSYAELNWFH